jgi:hypothetical protein
MIPIIIMICSFFIMLELSKLSIGWFLSDKNHLASLAQKLPKYTLNSKSIINDYSYNNYDPNFISDSIPSLLSKYYIDGVGLVPRWSKMHKLISQRFKELKQNN